MRVWLDAFGGDEGEEDGLAGVGLGAEGVEAEGVEAEGVEACGESLLFGE